MLRISCYGCWPLCGPGVLWLPCAAAGRRTHTLQCPSAGIAHCSHKNKLLPTERAASKSGATFELKRPRGHPSTLLYSSSMPCEGTTDFTMPAGGIDDLVKAIAAKSLAKVTSALKTCKPNQLYKDKTASYTPLHAAVKCGSAPIVEEVLKANADVNAQAQPDGASPLHWVAATTGGDAAAITRLLVKKKAQTACENKDKETPWHVAAHHGSVDVITELAASQGAAGLDSLSPGKSPVATAVLASQFSAVTALINAGAQLGAQDANGMTPLMLLVAAGRLGDALRVLDLGDCNVNAQASSPTAGMTALLMLAPGGPEVHMDSPGAAALLAMLLEKGASVDLQHPTSQETPLTWAVTNAKVELALSFIKKANKLNTKNGAGKSALDLAVAAGNDQLAAALLSAGADPGEGAAAMLKAAADSGKDAIVSELVKVMKAAQLTSAGLNFKSLTEKGLCSSALTYAQRFDKPSDSVVDSEGNTSLHQLSESGAPYDIILGLIKLGLGPNASNTSGDTPLHVAARAGHVEVCRALLDGGADALKRNAKNRRPKEQPKIPDATKDFLVAAEEAAKERKANKQSELWDDKMKATQTESAFGLRCL